jgi:hypothetical protein
VNVPSGLSMASSSPQHQRMQSLRPRKATSITRPSFPVRLPSAIYSRIALQLNSRAWSCFLISRTIISLPTSSPPRCLRLPSIRRGRISAKFRRWCTSCSSGGTSCDTVAVRREGGRCSSSRKILSRSGSIVGTVARRWRIV